MDAISPTIAPKYTSSSPLVKWNLPNCQVSLIGQKVLRGIVEYPETGVYKTKVILQFALSDMVPATIKQDFYAKVILSPEGNPTAVELCPRGKGAGEFYTQPAVLPFFQKAPLDRDPKTPEELVSVLKQIPPADQRHQRYLNFSSQFIKTFSQHPMLMKAQIDGLVTLVLSGNQEITHSVINELTKHFRDDTILNLDLVHGLADAIDRANPVHLNSDALIHIMDVIVERINKTHNTGAEKSQEEQLEALTRVLNSMVDANVCDLPREKQNEVKELLVTLSDSDSIGVQCLAAYAKEALMRVPNDETKLAAVFRVSAGVVKGIYYFYAAFNQIDPGKLVEGFFAFKEGANGILDLGKLIQGSVDDAVSSIQDGRQAIQKGTSSLRPRKLAWYDQIRYIEMLIASNAFQALEALLKDPRLEKDPISIYMVIERLHDVVVSHPNMEVRIGTLLLFQSLYQDHKTWNQPKMREENFKREGPRKRDIGHREAIRNWIGIKKEIVLRLSSYTCIDELKEAAETALSEIEKASKGKQRDFISRHKSKDAARFISFPISKPIALFASGSNAQYDLELKIQREKARVVEDTEFKEEKAFYVPLMGSDSGGSITFDLFQKVEEFLAGEQKILLLLGPSGSGKTFLSHILAERLWEQYQPEIGLIPFYIALSKIEHPGTQLIKQALEPSGFTVEEIANLKDFRQIVWILDGYDEIAVNASTSLFSRNELLNFKGKIIVTCRTEALVSNALPNDKSYGVALREIYFAPFSSTQMDYFIKKHIEKGSTKWKKVSTYRKYINKIPGLFELVQNPFILKLIVDSLPEIIKEHKQAPSVQQLTVTRYSLYGKFIASWFDKGLRRAGNYTETLDKAGLGTDNLNAEAKLFCVELAYAMQSRQLTHVQYNFRVGDPKWDTWLKHDEKPNYLRSMSPLKITKGDNAWDYAFLHRSLMEYFIAEGTKEALLNKGHLDANLKSIPLFKELLEPSVWLFLADVAKSDAVFKQELWNLIEHSKMDSQMAIASANAASILNLADFSFSRKDLRGAKLPGAYLERANFLGTDLRGSDLSRATMSGAVLSRALLDGAKMEDVLFGQWPIIQVENTIKVLISSFDERQLIGGSHEKILIWDVFSGEQLKEFLGVTGCITALLLLEGGKKLISGSDDGTIRIWDVDSGNKLNEFKDNESKGHIFALLLLDGDKKLASANQDNSAITIWDIESAKKLKKLDGHTNSVRCLISLEEGKRLASGGLDGTIRIWDSDSGKQVKKIQGRKSGIVSLISLEGGKKLASVGKDKTVRIWDLDTRKQLKEFRLETNQITSLFGGKQLASVNEDDQTIRIWDTESGEELRKLEGHTSDVSALTLLGKRLVSSACDKTIRIWDVEPGKEFKKRRGPEKDVTALVVLDGGEKFISASLDGTIRISESNSGHELNKFDSATLPIAELIPFEQGKKLFSVTFGKPTNCQIWDLEASIELKDRRMNAVNALTFIDGGTKFATAGDDGYVRIWDLKTGKKLNEFHGLTAYTGEADRYANIQIDEAEITSKGILTTLHQGKKLASLSYDQGLIQIWDLESGEQEKEMGLSAYTLITLDQGKKIVTGNFDNNIEILNLEISEGPKIITGHTQPVTTLASLDGEKKLVSASKDNTIRVWDLVSGKELLKISCPFRINKVSTMEPNFVLAGDDHGGIWFWKLNFDEKDLRPELLWVTNPALNCSETKLGNPVDLSEPNRRLLLQHGALNEKQ